LAELCGTNGLFALYLIGSDNSLSYKNLTPSVAQPDMLSSLPLYTVMNIILGLQLQKMEMDDSCVAEAKQQT
jgi:hypothetical protein